MERTRVAPILFSSRFFSSITTITRSPPFRSISPWSTAPPPVPKCQQGSQALVWELFVIYEGDVCPVSLEVQHSSG